MQLAKKNKQTQKGKKSFFQVDVIWLGPSCTERFVKSWHGLLKVFSSTVLNQKCLSLITETMTLRYPFLELSKCTCIGLSQKLAEWQKTNLSWQLSYLKQKPKLSDCTLNIKPFLFKSLRESFLLNKVVTKKESNYFSGYSRLNRGGNVAQKKLPKQDLTVTSTAPLTKH